MAQTLDHAQVLPVRLRQLDEEFFAAQQFCTNFYHGLMEESDIARGRPPASDFVYRLPDPA